MIDLVLLDPRPQRLDTDVELISDTAHRALLGLQLLAELHTIRTARSFSSTEYRFVVGLGFTSVFIALILFQRLRASTDPRAIQITRPNHTRRRLPTAPKTGPAGSNKGPHYRIRHDRIDKTGAVSLRRGGRMHRIGIGRAHKNTAVILLIDDLDIPVV